MLVINDTFASMVTLDVCGKGHEFLNAKGIHFLCVAGSGISGTQL